MKSLIVYAIFLLLTVTWESLTQKNDCQKLTNSVLTQPLKPDFNRGDLLFVCRTKDDYSYKAGEAVVVNVPKSNSEDHWVVRHVIEVDNLRGRDFVHTNGVHEYDDAGNVIQCGKLWTIQRENVVGRVTGKVPYIGWVSLILQEYNPKIIKWSFYSLLGLYLLKLASFVRAMARN